jgi:hypothetical protein
MANYLKMTKVSAILTLREHGWSQRRIARELGIHPDTVGRYIRLSSKDPKPAKAPTGSEGSKPVKAPTGSGDANVCDATSGRSQCESYRKIVEDKLQCGLSRQRIYQDLRDEHGFEGSYYSVRRFVKRLGQDRPIPQGPGRSMERDASSISPTHGFSVRCSCLLVAGKGVIFFKNKDLRCGIEVTGVYGVPTRGHQRNHHRH